MKKKFVGWLILIACCFALYLLTWISLELGVLDLVINKLIDYCGIIVAVIIGTSTYIYFDKKFK